MNGDIVHRSALLIYITGNNDISDNIYLNCLYYFHILVNTNIVPPY